MSDRLNRVVLGLLGLLLLAGGGLSVCLGAGVFGSNRSHRDVFDPTVVHWWNEGGWMSFAVVVAIGLGLLVLGLWLTASQLRRNDGRHRTPTVTFAPVDGARGETTLRAPALSHSLEGDLVRIPDVHDAMVGLFGQYPNVELRAVLDVADDVDLEALPGNVEEVLGRMEATTGIRPDTIRITVRFKSAARERQLT